MLELYAIHDRKVGIYNTPSFSRSLIDVQRSITTVLEDKNSNLRRFHEDFEIYRLGTFDENTGVLTANKPLLICGVTALLPRDDQFYKDVLHARNTNPMAGFDNVKP